MTPLDRIAQLVEPSLNGLGYDLVRVRLDGGTLQIMAERMDRRDMTVEDCATISRDLSALLDVEDPISEPYALEVSSPGLDRPLTRPEDYDRFRGHEAKLETRAPIDGQKRFRGRLAGLRGEDIIIDCDDMAMEIPYADIARGKLVLTDELIAASMKNEDG
jgi:ribosome maturation factor RimP